MGIAVPGESIPVDVLRVMEGDTLKVVDRMLDEVLRVRLWRMDAPEMSQESGADSANGLGEMLVLSEEWASAGALFLRPVREDRGASILGGGWMFWPGKSSDGRCRLRSLFPVETGLVRAQHTGAR